MKGAALALILCVVGAVPASATSDRFIDDDGRPAESALEWLAGRGVIHGCDPPADRRICPDERVTRAQAAKILVLLGRAEGILADRRPATIDHFTDDGTVWSGAAEEFIGHLADLDVVHGCDPPLNESFCPYDTLLRGQITKMVVRAFGLEAPPGYRSPWVDTQDHFFHEAARVAAYHGLLDTTAGVFGGYQPVTRGEFARFVVAAFEPDMCADNPFPAGRVADLEADHPGISFTAYAYHFATGCGYSMNPEARQQTASVFKVMVLAGTLFEAQADHRALTATERDLLEPMITRSANEPVRDLWRRFGGAPWFGEQADRFGMEETDVVGDHELGWGRTSTSAYDQGRLLVDLLVGESVFASPYRQEAFDLMTSVVSSQTWGVIEGVPPGWTVAHKNGFAGLTANSVGVVYDEDLRPVYAVAVLTFGWPSWEEGVPAVERVAGWVSSTLAE